MKKSKVSHQLKTLLYPCNVVAQEHKDGRVEVSSVDPLIMFLALHSPRAKEMAINASQKMQAVMDRLPAVVPVAV